LAKLSKTSVFKAHVSKPETQMDKTTRIAMKMVDDEAKQRQVKITRLRNTRLEREANSPPKTTATAGRKTRKSKAVTKQ
jgi:hypothetical protein